MPDCRHLGAVCPLLHLDAYTTGPVARAPVPGWPSAAGADEEAAFSEFSAVYADETSWLALHATPARPITTILGYYFTDWLL